MRSAHLCLAIAAALIVFAMTAGGAIFERTVLVIAFFLVAAIVLAILDGPRRSPGDAPDESEASPSAR